ncbi:hypothetical protein HPB51_015618 [Rhipicephalus microplus]|uniref:Uncharacterized protein n=1 Tax=Rhipicephalus microplus TaxID=6941 RepID=A0A9J6DHT2_RHIMP|nr:hypothetical protein HPB51_015618 [Rhipicephalus microplus]
MPDRWPKLVSREVGRPPTTFAVTDQRRSETFVVTYQLKIITTALFSLALLNKKLAGVQWVALLVLFVGVALVQLAQIAVHPKTVEGHVQQPLVGFLAILAACCLSGFAVSVYAFEFHLSWQFVAGALLVMGSIFLYSRPNASTAQLRIASRKV